MYFYITDRNCFFEVTLRHFDGLNLSPDFFMDIAYDSCSFSRYRNGVRSFSCSLSAFDEFLDFWYFEVASMNCRSCGDLGDYSSCTGEYILNVDSILESVI